MSQHFPNNRAAYVDPGASDRIVAGFCTFAGLPVREVYTAAEVVDLLRRVGYDVTPGTLAEFARKGYIGEPAGEEWTAPFVHALAAALECRRRWLPTPNRLHDFKKSVARIQIESLRAEGEPVFADLEGYSLEDLFLQLVACDERGLREALYE